MLCKNDKKKHSANYAQLHHKIYKSERERTSSVECHPPLQEHVPVSYGVVHVPRDGLSITILIISVQIELLFLTSQLHV
jgi:hypothetical protein